MFINFYKCQKLATELLAKQQLSTTKINAMKLQYDKNIVFFTIQEYAKTTNTPITDYYLNWKLADGYTIAEDELYIVLYNENLCENRRNWTIAHEIGHIYLGHKQDTDVEEIEANFFAAQLLMPEYVIYDVYKNIGQITENELLDLFFVSSDAAKKRLKTFNNKHSYSCNSEDKMILAMLKEEVTEYCKKYNNDRYYNPLPYHMNESINFSNAEDDWLYGFL